MNYLVITRGVLIYVAMRLVTYYCLFGAKLFDRQAGSE